jgi:HAE1 family hydrophobic/amphiphilic exporter-1
VDFAAGWGKKHLALNTLSSNGTNWSAAFVATVPLFNGWRTKGQVAQARSNLASLNITELKLREGISVEVRMAIDALNEATEILGALTGTVEQAERLLFLSEKGFELGVKTRLEVQDAEQNLRQARYNLAAAQRDYQVARVNLDWAGGTLDGGMPPSIAKP